MLTSTEQAIIFKQDSQVLQVETWGPHAVRIRAASRSGPFPPENWALSEALPPGSLPHIDCPDPSAQPTLPAPGQYTTKAIDRCNPARLTHGNLQVSITPFGTLTIRKANDEPILLEKNRTRLDTMDPSASSIEVAAREFKPIVGSNYYQVAYRLESLDPHERIYGGGQYQEPNLDLKGCELELAQRNSQATVPFYVSSKGYGLLWNVPSVGRVTFGKNGTTFHSAAAAVLDVWLVCPPKGDTPPWKTILKLYADVTGHAPAMPDFALGFWQSKLRYRTQEELLTVARTFRQRQLPLSVIVVDFFHWPTQGDWKFDLEFFPDPRAMVAELEEMGVKLLVSVWPTVDRRSENYATMVEHGHLIRSERGFRLGMDYMGNTVHADFTSPDARQFVWDVCKQNYWNLGVRMFWLDEAEPEYAAYDFDNYRYDIGPVMAVGNIYPLHYAQAFWDGQVAAGQQPGEIVNLIRCAWAGSQKFGTLMWSGDIASSWSSFRRQLTAGLNCGMSGIPWWTTDIGGFHGGWTDTPEFRELLVRWFQWGCFCPVMRLHGDRKPIMDKLGEGGGSDCQSGAANEPWSFGEANYPILVKYLRLRERLRSYIAALMHQASHEGLPLMRPMFLEFPDDELSWACEEQYMFGAKYLVAPVMEPGVKVCRVYLPSGSSWARLKPFENRDELEGSFQGGQHIDVELQLEDMPVFVRTD